jgi:hypothetical protein
MWRVGKTRPDAAYLSGTIFRNELPILLVMHYEDGDWGFFDGGTFDRDDAAAVHIFHVFDEHPDVRPLHDLPFGWAAERSATDAEWQRYPWPDDPAPD